MQLKSLPIFMMLWALATGMAACEKRAAQSPALDAPPENGSDSANFASPEEALRMAEALRASGASAEALAVMASAYRRFPGNSAVTSAYGRLALVNGQEELARRLLSDALAASPGDWRALSARGVIESRSGNAADARASLTHAWSVSGEDPVALNNLAVTSLLDGQPERAVPLLNQALAAPGLTLAHRHRVKRNMALALAMLGRFAEADAFAGEKLSRTVPYSDRATIRRLIGVGVPLAPANQPAGYAGSWLPVVEPAGS